MTETTLTEVIVSCPSCARPMSFRSNYWQCLACHPIPADIRKCKTQICKRPLTRLGEPWNCWICLHCNTHPSKVSPRQTERPDRKLLDEKMTEERVKEIAGERMTADDIREIVRDVMVEFSTKEEPDPDYPPTQAEIAKITQLPEAVGAGDFGSNVHIDIKIPKPETWMQKAKRLGVQTHIPDGRGMRKKVDIMADMETKENETVQKELRPEEQAGSSGSERTPVDTGDAKATE